MSEIFDQYEQDYSRLTNSISRKISEVSNRNGESRRSLVNQIKGDLSEADDILKRLSMEVGSLPPEKRNKLNARLRFHENDFKKLQGDLRRAENSVASNQANRTALFGDYDDPQMRDIDQRSRLLGGTEKLDRTSTRIEESRRLAEDTVALGGNILTDLGNQRETIVRAHGHVHKANDDISKSGRVIGAMQRRVATNKMIMAMIILVLMGTIGTIVYFKWGKKKDSSDDSKDKNGSA
eukprot:GCRY01000683.1.p1 GENE.GCRY01000683.1~~GCRY01000683.1.p1  ORF type:complete len:276 (+),score=37.21 GCRY01000683.1:120-830(+)